MTHWLILQLLKQIPSSASSLCVKKIYPIIYAISKELDK